MVSDNSPIDGLLKDNENIVYIPKEENEEHIIVRNLDETVNLLDKDWEIVEELNDDMFLMRKSFNLENEKREI